MFRDRGQLICMLACCHPQSACHPWTPSQPWGQKNWSTWTLRTARRSMARLVVTGQVTIYLGNMWQSWGSAKPRWRLMCLKDWPERGAFSQTSPLWVSKAATWQWMFGSFSTRSHLSASWRKWMHLGVIYSAQSIPYPVRVARLFNVSVALHANVAFFLRQGFKQVVWVVPLEEPHTGISRYGDQEFFSRCVPHASVVLVNFGIRFQCSHAAYFNTKGIPTPLWNLKWYLRSMFSI